MAFQFKPSGRKLIVKAFPDCVPTEARTRYIKRAEVFIGQFIDDERHIAHAKRCDTELRKTLKTLRSATDNMLALFENVSNENQGVPFFRTLHKGSPIYLVTLDFKQSLTKLEPLDEAFFSPAKASRGAKPKFAQAVLVMNLKNACPMSSGQRGCWSLVDGTLQAYAKQRTEGMPAISLVSDAMKRQARRLSEAVENSPARS